MLPLPFDTLLTITQPREHLPTKSQRRPIAIPRTFQELVFTAMASIRTSGPAVNTIFRFAAQPAATRRCAHCLKAQRCPFSSFRPARQASKRPLMTETWRPHTLGSDVPPPPKNAGTPETSISSSSQTSWPPSAPWERKDSDKGVSEREGEAQKSKPTAAAQEAPQVESQPAPPQPSPSKPKKSKLRPRKAPITLTPTAVSQLRELFESPEKKYIRIGVKNRGCSGLAYHLEYVDKAGAFDETVEQDGVKVLIDSKALFSIIGSEMDWHEDKLSARFVFRNPNISKCCPVLPDGLEADVVFQRRSAAAANHSASHDTPTSGLLHEDSIQHCRTIDSIQPYTASKRMIAFSSVKRESIMAASIVIVALQRSRALLGIKTCPAHNPAPVHPSPRPPDCSQTPRAPGPC